jgi:carbamoyltransferase
MPNEYTEIQKDMAYAIQESTENRMIDLIRKAHEETGETNIVVCGGYGLNCVANYKYLQEFPDLNIYCEPISHDGGTSIGGANYIWHEVCSNKEPKKQSSVYYGPQYNPSDYEEYLEGLDVSDTNYEEVSSIIREGNIVTIFQGRSEGGPRALGNRSVMFDPTIVDGKDHVNEVKHREWFRPFACSIKKEKVHEWFDLAGREESPHMMYAVNCLEGVEKKIPSVIHVDGTCRIQTVTEEQNKHYYNLIDAFEKLSGVPILFNTSFNLGGEPLVETIEDAIKTLQNSDIEYLYLPEIQKLVKIPNK